MGSAVVGEDVVGLGDGLAEGFGVGTEVGSAEGFNVGIDVGFGVGLGVGTKSSQLHTSTVTPTPPLPEPEAMVVPNALLKLHSWCSGEAPSSSTYRVEQPLVPGQSSVVSELA